MLNNAESIHLHTMLEKWEALSTVPVDLEGRIALPFAQFEAGTPRSDIIEVFTEYNADIFDESAAKNGDFRTQFDKEKSRMEITIDLDPRQQVEENFNGGGDSASFDDVEESQSDEVLFTLDEIKNSFGRGNSSGSNRREFGETEYHFENKVVNDCSDLDGLKSELLDKLEEVRKLVEQHVIANGLKAEDSQQVCILNHLRDAMNSVNGLEACDVKTDRTTPVLIDVQVNLAIGTPETLHEDDEEIPGRYLVRVPSNYSYEQMASIALDSFHTKYGIEVIEDFTFTVIDGSRGVEIFEDDNAESYQWDSLGLHVACLGSVPNYGDDALSVSTECVSGLKM